MNVNSGRRPHQPTTDWEMLRRRRARLLATLRSFFDQRGFLEVETPVLSRDTVVDRWLDPVPASDPRTGLQASPPDGWYLQTSPEFGMKRLLAFDRAHAPVGIYQITRAFRVGELGASHNPEFTMLEWYRTDDSYQQGVDLLAELALSVLGCSRVRQWSYRDAFIAAVAIDPFQASTEDLRRRAIDRMGAAAPVLKTGDRDSWLNALWAECVEPSLQDNPTIILDYPASQAALARTETRAGVEVACRFELYYRGHELANGYLELLDPDELLRRNREVNLQRTADGKSELPNESCLVEAMRDGLPPCVGVALGVDRLLMAMTGATTIDKVMAFPYERA